MLGVKLLLYLFVNYILISGNAAQTVPTWPPINYHNNYQNPTVLGAPKNSFNQQYFQKPVIPNYSDINGPFEELQTYVWDKLISSTIASALASRYNPILSICEQNQLDAIGKPINAIKAIPNVVNNYIIIPSDLLGRNQTAIENIYTETNEINRNEVIKQKELESNVNLRQNCNSLNIVNDNISKREKIESIYDKIKKFESLQNQNHNLKTSTKATLENGEVADKTDKSKEKIIEKQSTNKKTTSKCNEKKKQSSCNKKRKESTGKKQKRRKENSHKVGKHSKSESQCCECGKIKKEKNLVEKERTLKPEPKKKKRVTNFDQICVDIDDVLNINQEYPEHDCECIRNSRNNGNSKKSKKQYSYTSDDFSNQYMSFVNDVIWNQQYGSFSFDPHEMFPYDFEKLFQIPLYSNIGDQKKGQSSKQKSSNKNDSITKSSNRKVKKKDKIKEIVLTPTTIEHDVTQSNTDSVEASEDVKEEYETVSFETEALDMLDSKKILPVIEDDVVESSTYNAPYKAVKNLFDDEEYYPDFTVANGAYITSSEEEEWNEFHSRNFYSGDRGEKREINPNKGIFKNKLNGKNSQPNHFKLISKENMPKAKDNNNVKDTNDKISFGSPLSLEPDLRSRKLHNTEIPHYIKLIYHSDDEIPANNKESGRKKNYVETVYAPSKVINYSFPPDDAVYLFATEDSSERNVCVKEGDTTIVLSKSLD